MLSFTLSFSCSLIQSSHSFSCNSLSFILSTHSLIHSILLSLTFSRFSYSLPSLSLLPSLQDFTQSLLHSLLFSSSFASSVIHSLLLSLPHFTIINPSLIHSEFHSLLFQTCSFHHVSLLTRFILSFIAATVKITEEERILVMEKIAYVFAIPEKDGLKPDIYKIKLEFISACVEYQKILKIQLFQNLT